MHSVQNILTAGCSKKVLKTVWSLWILLQHYMILLQSWNCVC